jgi:hypothetical protein
VSHYGALPFTLKKYLKAKRRIMEKIFKYFTISKTIYSSNINPLKQTKILQDIIITCHSSIIAFEQTFSKPSQMTQTIKLRFSNAKQKGLRIVRGFG